jgi:putative transposase
VSRIVRRVRQAGVYFVTTDTWERREVFRQHRPAEIVVDQILECRDRGFYSLHEFVLMPDHLHVLLTPGEETTLEKALQMIKGGSAFKIRKELDLRWPVWHSGFHDRWVRDGGEYQNYVAYVRQNPVKARLVERSEDYPWSSANEKFVGSLSSFDDFSG